MELSNRSNTSSPTVASGLVYVGLNDGKVLALNASSGAVMWSYQNGGAVYSSPAVADNVVYFGSWDKSVYVVNALTGALLWSHPTGSYVQSSPAVANGVIYVGSYDHLTSSNSGSLYALDDSTGKMLWSYPVGTEVLTSPIVANKVVYAGGNDNNFFAFNASNGAKLWNYQIGSYSSDSWSSAAVAEGVLYVGFGGGTLFAFGASNETPTSTPILAPTPTPVTKPNATVSAVTNSVETVNLALNGNITSSQMSNVTIAVKNATSTSLSFTVTGESGTIGFSNITIPKSVVPLETTPLIFIDELAAQSQGFIQDAGNYYVWYTTHFSLHQILIMFTSTNSSPNLTGLNGQASWFQILYGIVAALVVVTLVVVGLFFALKDRKKKVNI